MLVSVVWHFDTSVSGHIREVTAISSKFQSLYQSIASVGNVKPWEKALFLFAVKQLPYTDN